MNHKLLPLAWPLCLTLLLWGCGSSPPNNFYVLAAQPLPTPGGTTPVLGVGPVGIPEYLSRQNMVYQQVDNTLQVASLDLWAEPLDSGIQRVLVLNLAGLLNTQNVSYFPWHPARAPQLGVEVNLLQLDANASAASLTAEWLVYRPDGSGTVNRRISRLQLPLPAGTKQPEQVAAAYSTLLFQLSEIIAGVITAEGAAQRNGAASGASPAAPVAP